MIFRTRGSRNRSQKSCFHLQIINLCPIFKSDHPPTDAGKEDGHAIDEQMLAGGTSHVPPVAWLLTSPVKTSVIIKETVHHPIQTGYYIEGEDTEEEQGSGDQPNGHRRRLRFNAETAVQRSEHGNHQRRVDERRTEHAKGRSDVENEAFTATEVADRNDGEDVAEGDEQ